MSSGIRLSRSVAFLRVPPLLLALHCSPANEPTEEPSGDGDATASTGGNGDPEGTGGSGTGGNSGGDGDIQIDPDMQALCPVDQLDFLFVIDNSVSMADKQELLRGAVPNMIGALVNPPCLGTDGASSPPAADGTCPEGTEREYAPLTDIHLGVISSSLGGHGSAACPRSNTEWNYDDQAHLIPSVRPGVPTDNPLGFLAWTGGDTAAAELLISNFAEQVAAVGEVGCGYEATLEAWYRFLVDPQPPQDLVASESGAVAIATDELGNPLIDTTVLAQREAFLRPESLVNIIVLTDENDCSMMDGGAYYNNAGYGYLVAHDRAMTIATPACEVNPNDACCFSCLQTTAPDGCDASACDAEEDSLPPENDRPNVRCFDHKRRFGVDLLYPTQRYVDGLKEREIVDARTGERVANPLLEGAGVNAGTPRPEGRIYFTGIVGVPWQDLVTDASLSDPAVLEYLPAAQLSMPVDIGGSQATRWDLILGSPGLAMSDLRCRGAEPAPGCGAAPVPPLDPFMIESISERPAGLTNPISGDAIVASTSTDPRANAINGHEVNFEVVDDQKYADGMPVHDDLQYACTFPLTTPKADCQRGDPACDCGDEPSRNRPLCQDPAGGTASTTQYYGKAYPGTRILQVLRDFGDNSVVSSICPKGDHGYVPAVEVIIDTLKECFPPVVR